MVSAKQIQSNLDEIRSRIDAACKRSNRNPDSVTLIAVSKMNPAEAVIAAADAGQYIFGENRVQELRSKQDEIGSYSMDGNEVVSTFLNDSREGISTFSKDGRELEWHLIGHLQTNKVKDAVGNVVLIHSVDSLKLAEAISKESIKKGITSDILLEVNISNEESKFGLSPDQAGIVAAEISKLPNVKIRGLMTVAPYTENPETNRIYFKKLKDLSVDISSKNIDNISMDVLSMGMTGDFEVAIEEGATHVRVGTGIFGARDYSH
ncbi:MAG: YggS family pyridoxal phosphate-dependent enzyme [Lachnospiraceae bacterium]|nr:YggS family pyridoxal phosphate-dependent enzyme [Lachnospiraceae bacterium]